MSIITISRGSLSGGTALAECVAQRLGCGCVSREVLVEAAAKYGVPEAKLSDFLDKVPGFWERLTVSRRLYLLFIQAMMCEFAQQGNLVYHGHAGHLLLKGIDHVLKVRLIAPLADRITAVMERQAVSPKAALHYIHRVDEERRRRMRDLFEVDWRDPALYDVVVNLEEMSLETAADVVVSLAQHTEYQPTVASQKALDDLTLRCRVQAAMAAHPATIGIMVEAQADGGSMRLGWDGGVQRAARGHHPHCADGPRRPGGDLCSRCEAHLSLCRAMRTLRPLPHRHRPPPRAGRCGGASS